MKLNFIVKPLRQLQTFVKAKIFKKTFYLPADQTARTVLLAMKCGYIGGSFKINGIDNFLTRFLWRRYLDLHKDEKEYMFNYLNELSDAFKSLEFWETVKN